MGQRRQPAPEDRKVNKNDLLRLAAARAQMPLRDMRRAYNAFVFEITAVLCGGKDVSLTGFGTFGLKTHKGHPIRFNAEEGKVKDYLVMRFTPSDVLMTNIRSRCAEREGGGQDG